MPQARLEHIHSARSETARDINRRIVLNLVRSRQPISRADLARLSGLQRSTISLITGELLENRWIIESATGRLPRGRRPTYLRLHDRRSIIGVDIRPTTTTIAVADLNARVTTQQVLATPNTAKAAISHLSRRLLTVLQSQSESTFEGIGISIAGRVDTTTGKVSFAPNLHWQGYDIAGPLGNATGLDVEVENAANACALAHVWFTSDSTRDLVAVTVAEGVGTGVLANGQLVRGVAGLAGEFGHMTLDPNGPTCACGNKGCWEVFASNTAALREYMDSADLRNAPAFPDLLTLADQGDARAIRALSRMAAYLGRGAATLVSGLSPSVLLFVGDLTRSWQRFGPVIEKEISARCVTPHKLRVMPADEGSTARLRGAFALVLQKHFGLPSIAAG